MNTEEFRDLLDEALGLQVELPDLADPLDDVPGWDSVYLLKLVTAIEQRTGSILNVPVVLDARTLDDIRLATTQ